MSSEQKTKDEEKEKEEKPKKPKSINNIANLTTLHQAETVSIDIDSPRFKQAMENLHYTRKDFVRKRNFKENPDDDRDVIRLRKHHYYSRLMNVINERLNERRRISKRFDCFK